jgi:tetratricopeptide (TPR) repeat protein
MTKRKRRPRKSASAKEQGIRAFKRSAYDIALNYWEQAKSAVPATLLAEAHFRQGLRLAYGKPPNFEQAREHVAQAIALQPEVLHYTYHLGLIAHQLGDLEAAISAYQQAQAEATLAPRVAYVWSMALLEQGTDPSASPLWAELSTEVQTRFNAALTFRRRPYTVSDTAPALWRGMAALDQGEIETAHAQLTTATESEKIYAAWAHYYLGVLAGQTEDWHEARRQWTKAVLKGLQLPRLHDNLGESYHRLAEERLSDQDFDGALEAATEAYRHVPDDNRLQLLLSNLHQQRGYAAARDGDWEAASQQWQQAYDFEGGSFRQAYNLALAAERAAAHIQAGEHWREALRRRPRSDNHPDAISDEQVAKLWRRTAEAYVRAGEYEEAIHVYKLAVKWNPDSLDTRIALVEGLLNNGQLTAAQNELERILNKDNDYIPALLLMGETCANMGYWWQASAAERYYRRVLELEPDNARARQGLSDYYLDRGDSLFHWRGPDYAIEYYEQALALQPDNPQILAVVGGCYLAQGESAKAQEFLERAQALGADNLQVVQELVHIYIVNGQHEKAWAVTRQTEAALGDLPFQFYLLIGLFCIEAQQVEMASPWLERVIEVAAPEEDALLVISEALMITPAIELAQTYIQRAMQTPENVGVGHAMLGMLAIRQGDPQTAESHLREADKIARRTRDAELKAQVAHTRQLLQIPSGLLNMMFNNPGMFDNLLNGSLDDFFFP